MKIRLRTPFVLARIFVVLAAVLYGCGGGGGGSYGGGNSMTPPPAVSTVEAVDCSTATSPTMVSIVSQAVGFSPSGPTVPVNTVVEWTNNDTMTHTVTSTTVPSNGAFDSGNVAPGAKVCLKFTSAGTFNYHCSIHPTTMIGSVIVQ